MDRGVALVVVLSFIVLLMAVLMAYFSQSLLDRQVSKSSTSSSLVQHFADGAMNAIIGDLRAEIKAGSTTNVSTGPVIYYPQSPTNMVPALAGSTGTNGLENLVKRSSSSNVFYPGAPTNRAAASPTTNASANGRYISPARWNKPLFIRPTSTNDLTPVASAGFVAPDWIYVARDGSNPTQWNTNMRWSETAPTAVVGRYAYAIYDEGGLLDANVAGYPTTLTNQPAGASNAAYKRALPYADLTQILGSNNVDAMVGWRNKATLDQSVTNYIGYVEGNTNGFLKTANKKLTAAKKSDRMFVSRQELVNFFSTQLGGSSDPAVLNALQYLTTFSRALDQPSVAPASNRPKIVSGIGTVSGANYYSDYGGGNSGSGNDDRINPQFLAKAVTSPFTRKDGTTAAVGELLVKKRFPLECLGWITCKGPSASRAPYTDTDMAALLSKPGVTKDLLDRGTPENIRNYFGLVWDSTDHLWNYAPGAYGSPLASAPVAGPVQLLETITGREPNFIELLKATITAGSLGKSLGGGSVVGAASDDSIPYEVSTGVQAIHLRDSSVDAHVIQIAANIIEQAAVDGYPKRIRFDDSVKKRIFAGVENLPYFYGWRNIAVKLADSIPSTDPPSWKTFTSDSAWNVTLTTSTPDPAGYGIYNPPSTSPGVGVELIIPEIWNPHDQNSAVGVIRPGAGELRVVADAIIDIPDVASVTNGLPGASPTSASNISLKNPFLGFQEGPDPFNLNPNTSALVFGDNGGALFREPTALRSPNIPSGSNLTVSDTHELQVLRTTLNTLAGNQAVAADGSLTDYRDPYNKYLGIYVGHFPLAWFTGWQNLVWSNAFIQTTQNGANYTSMIVRVLYDCMYNQPELTFRVQCKDAYGNWIDYDTKFWTTPHPGGAYRYWSAHFDPYDTQNPAYNYHNPAVRMNNLIGYFCNGRTFDPRTSRFGVPTFYWADILWGQRSPLDPSGTPVAWDTWASQKANALAPTFYNYNHFYYMQDWGNNSQRSTKIRIAANAGFHFSISQNIVGGGQNGCGYLLDEILTQNNPQRNNYFDDSAGQFTATGYYTDADGVIRRAMGAYSSPGYSSGGTSSDTGLPTSTATANWNTATPSPTSQSQSRPIILHRPFRSVAELGYVFRDFPWKNLDFFSPESGDTGLLDVFCIHDSSDAGGLVAGKVNLNTRQAPVIQAILAGAYKDEEAGSSSPPTVTSSESATLANLLVARNTSAAAGKGPLQNVSELVGAWVSGTGTGAVYDGFSKDIPTAGNGPAQVIQRFRESAIRPLANCGQTRIWNLMIDIVAQSGRFPASADSLGKFVVEAEQRRWVHVAIDRLTGKVLDLQIEQVNE